MGTAAAFTGKGKDLLFGKKDRGTAGKYLELDPSLKKTVEAGRVGQQSQLKLLGAERERLKAPVTRAGIGRLVGAQLGSQERQARAGVEDTSRRARDIVAQRGLSGSTAGIRAALAPQQQLGEKIGAIRSQAPLLQEGLFRQRQAQRLGQIGQVGSGVSQVLGTPGAQRAFQQGRAATGRSGGLAGVAGAIGGGIIGAKFGAPGAGAQAGAGVARSLGNL